MEPDIDLLAAPICLLPCKHLSLPQSTLNREFYENTNGYVLGRHSLKSRTVKIGTEEMKKVLRQKGYHGGCVKIVNLVRKTNILKGH